uniref:Putative photosystem I PsaA/PsaB n=1 Tax=Helianthus annuus TaxID=4232 RepID=A0A1Y3BXD0_HELAN
MPDKKDFGYVSVRWPGRGGTVIFRLGTHFIWQFFGFKYHWMGYFFIGIGSNYIWQGNVSQFNESSTYLMGWLEIFMVKLFKLIMDIIFWYECLSVWAWMFLFGHLVWLLDFVFNFWRGYWQELIEL